MESGEILVKAVKSGQVPVGAPELGVVSVIFHGHLTLDTDTPDPSPYPLLPPITSQSLVKRWSHAGKKYWSNLAGDIGSTIGVRGGAGRVATH